MSADGIILQFSELRTPRKTQKRNENYYRQVFHFLFNFNRIERAFIRLLAVVGATTHSET